MHAMSDGGRIKYKTTQVKWSQQEDVEHDHDFSIGRSGTSKSKNLDSNERIVRNISNALAGFQDFFSSDKINLFVP